MLRLVLLSLVFSASAVHARTLICRTNPVDQANSVISVNFDSSTLLMEIDGPSWTYKGHVTVQKSKVTGQAWISIPEGHTFPAMSFELKKSGQVLAFDLGGKNFRCE